MKHSSVVVLMCLVAGCAQAPERQKPTVAPPQPQAAAPAPAPSQPQVSAPAPAPAPVPAPAAAAAPARPPETATSGGQGGETVSGAVTKIDKEAGLLELQTPSGWSQFIVTDPERKNELAQVTRGERVDVKVQVQGSERKVIAVLRRNPPAATQVESK